MAIIVEFSVKPEDFKLGRLLCLGADVRLHVEQLVPMGDKVMPFSWVSGDLASFEENIRGRIEYEVILEDNEGGNSLYRLEWETDKDELIRGIIEFNGSVLDAEGDDKGWSFRVRFNERDHLSDFREHCEDNGVDIQLLRIYNPIDVSGGSRMGMTAIQADTVSEAYKRGYFDIPRRTGLVELGESYGVSDQAISERIRRATAELVRSSLLVGDRPSFSEDDSYDS